MHKTKLGEFKYLVVITYKEEERKGDHVFCDNDQEESEWLTKKICNEEKFSGSFMTMKDLNYLLNQMVRSKGKKTGQELYEIYMENYPDDEQKTRVTDFWNK